ncbi:MAG: c-type cytochrome [Gemmatimonadaceae bacterium]|nr:c-type cytochrome [Gemmatimonadaceae bacterium]
MANQDEDRLLEHDYDGIQEYDNPMPRWWLWIFYATILFVPFYYVAPGFMGEGPGMIAAYEADVAAHTAALPPQPAAMDDATLLAVLADADELKEGGEVFTKNCAACHRADGGGLIGPNLTDAAWIHGGAPSAIYQTISAGVLAKGMPAWDRILKPDELKEVAAYVMSLKGTNPPSPKAPEGVVDTTTAAPSVGK